MSIKRREFIKMLPIGALLPTQILNGLTSQINFSADSLVLDINEEHTNQLFNNAIIIDGLVI